jgi:hypothetical protein
VAAEVLDQGDFRRIHSIDGEWGDYISVKMLHPEKRLGQERLSSRG